MKTDKKLLNVLERKSLHVHQLPNDSGDIFKVAKKMWNPIDTHYVMCGGDVVHIGTPSTIERFAYSYQPNQ